MPNPTSYASPIEQFCHWEKTSPDRVFLRQPFPGKGYTDFTYKEAGRQVRALAAALRAKGLPPGSHVAILSKNCAHWIMADLAIWMAGHVSVPLYPNLTEHSVRDILTHGDCKLAFVGKLDDVGSYRRGVPQGVPCIAFPYHDVPNAERWEDLAKAEPLRDPVPRGLDDLATIIYTSGTTGEPKGVMHPFRSFAVAGTEILNVIPMTPDDRFFSYLPLAHVAERILIETCGIYGGASIAFAESIDTFPANLQTIQPTIFLSVPRLWQKFHFGILAKMPQKKLSLLLSLPLLSTIVKKKIRHALGLAHARILVTGAAPTPPSLIEWFATLGMPIQEAYGMTENFAYSHFNRAENIKIGTVGQPWPKVKTRIAPDGEIQIATPCDFLGYYKSKSPRSDYFEGEYLKTGDRGEIDGTGHLAITGRTKELFKTSKGKYVAPAPIESKLAASPHLESVCVVGANLASPLALATLGPGAKSVSHDVLETDLSRWVDSVNQGLDPHERVSKLVVVKDSWTVEGGHLTPSMKVKRAVIEKHYGGRLSQWADGDRRVAWE